jgi:hypothetical protein
MNWDLPTFVKINGINHPIRNECDYRVVLDVISALNDEELTYEEKILCALFIFYEDNSKIQDAEETAIAVKEMFKIINCGEEEEQTQNNKPRLMDWEHDFKQIAPPVSRVLGYDIRTPSKYTHWYSFLGGYQEIGGDCIFATIVSIRNKRAKSQKLEKWELDFLRENRKMIDIPQKLTADEEELLNSDW